ncbi:uncharacterized protein [Palaemon carinicauda]|uniref:uncharacterized protein n=1 Tax=Palaemon carinicauda TaxID=392227 RepID=UPI0035B631D8
MLTWTLKTAPNFKSIDPAVPDADTMEDYLSNALDYQYMFEKRTTPWEMAQWDPDELQSFKIDLEKVDRLYHISFIEDGCVGQEYELIARLNHKGRLLYVELTAGCDYTGFDCQGYGIIFVSSDANLFLNLVLTNNCKKDLIHKSLSEDGVETEELSIEYNACSRMFLKNTPMLKYLCHMSIYENRIKLEPHLSTLPKILKKSVDEFIKFKEAKEAYDEC